MTAESLRRHRALGAELRTRQERHDAASRRATPSRAMHEDEVMSSRPPAPASASYGAVFPAAGTPEDLAAFVQAIEGMSYDEV